MSAASRRASGFTLIEIMIVTAIFATIFVLFGETFIRTQAVYSASSTHLRAEETTRLSLTAIGKVLRGADFDSVVLWRGGVSELALAAGWEKTAPGPANEIRFSRVVDWNLAGIVLGPEERIFRRTTTRAVDGVASPGEVVWAHDGVEVILATNVPGRESLRDTNGDGDRDAGETFTDTNGNGRWDPGFAVGRFGSQIRVWITSFATASDRTLDFASFDGTWTLRN